MPPTAAECPLPLLGNDRAQVVAWRGGQAVGRAEFLGHARRLAGSLQDGGHVLNLCDDRYKFLVVYAAALMRGQTSLLPHNRTEHAMQQVLREHPGAQVLDDAAVDVSPVPPAGRLEEIPAIPGEQAAAIVFTSGSTGEPAAHPKRWGSLVEGARCVQQCYLGGGPLPAGIVATVAPQHMFGLEASVMLPLVSGVPVHAARPFFPADVHRCLAEIPEPRVLVTTPYHLGVFLQAGLDWPPVALIISATAPMAPELAARAEAAFGARVLEIFGSTESGAIASRRTATEDLWTLYDGLRITAQVGQRFVEGGHLHPRVPLRDRLEMSGSHRFSLLGRDEDLVKVGGKRCSLGELNRVLTDIPGVVDGVFVAPEDDGAGIARLAALAVAPGKAVPEILQALGQRVDPAFLPRPLHLVDRLPRNVTGKLARRDLLDLLARLGGQA